MKKFLLGWLILLSVHGFCQGPAYSISSIDWRSANTEAPDLDSLVRVLIQPYHTEAEKCRSLYAWVTTHIRYNTAIVSSRRSAYQYTPSRWDTAAVWRTGDEMSALRVFDRRVAVCDGYARLFKVMCNYAGLAAEVVQGYGRTNVGSQRFATNHSWNAVRIDSVWGLVDVTWASGYVSVGDEYTARQNDAYYLPRPKDFATDHCPEDLRWALLSGDYGWPEMRRSPFRSKHFIKYGITGFTPAGGRLQVVAGDTVQFSISLRDLKSTKNLSPDAQVDTAEYKLWPASAFLPPADACTNEIKYTWIVQPGVAWLHLLYNDDVVLRYQVELQQPVVKMK